MRSPCFGLMLALALVPGARASNLPGPGYPLSLPQTLRGTVVVPSSEMPVRPAATLAELYPVLAACWQTPSEPGNGQVTVRFSLRRDGSVIGMARIAYAAGETARVRAGLSRAALDAIRLCTPADITPGLGRAIAGRPVALRFVLRHHD